MIPFTWKSRPVLRRYSPLIRLPSIPETASIQIKKDLFNDNPGDASLKKRSIPDRFPPLLEISSCSRTGAQRTTAVIDAIEMLLVIEESVNEGTPPFDLFLNRMTRKTPAKIAAAATDGKLPICVCTENEPAATATGRNT